MADDGGPDLVEAALGIVGSYALGALVRLGVPDALEDDGTPVPDVAGRLGVSPDVLFRLLRAATALGACTETAPGRFAPSEAGRMLRVDHPSGMYAFVRMYTDPLMTSAWPGIEAQVRTGEVAFDIANGEPFFARLAAQPAESERFNTAMRGFTAQTSGPLTEHGGFGRFGTVVDVGGGDGTMLAALLAAHPALRGIVFDTPEGAAQTPATLAAAGVEGRCAVETGDFFTGVPAGGDAYLLKHIVHDWPEEKAATILRRCRDVLPDHGRVLVVETVLPEAAGTDALPYLLDMTMLLMGGGQERSRAEFDALFRRAGLEPDGATELPGTAFTVLEAVPAR